jgi:hypothetical protein
MTRARMHPDTATVRAALALMNSRGFSEQMKMYGFLVAVECMEPCEAYALSHDRPVRHGGEKCTNQGAQP